MAAALIVLLFVVMVFGRVLDLAACKSAHKRTDDGVAASDFATAEGAGSATCERTH